MAIGLEVRDLAKSYGGKRAVDGISLNVRAASFTRSSAPMARARPRRCA